MFVWRCSFRAWLSTLPREIGNMQVVVETWLLETIMFLLRRVAPARKTARVSLGEKTVLSPMLELLTGPTSTSSLKVNRVLNCRPESPSIVPQKPLRKLICRSPVKEEKNGRSFSPVSFMCSLGRKTIIRVSVRLGVKTCASTYETIPSRKKKVSIIKVRKQVNSFITTCVLCAVRKVWQTRHRNIYRTKTLIIVWSVLPTITQLYTFNRSYNNLVERNIDFPVPLVGLGNPLPTLAF